MSSMRSHDRLPPSVAVPSQGRTIPVRAAPSTRPLADIVPGLVGVSVGRLDAGGAPYTWAATDDVVSALDACQYIAGGPCVRAAVERPRRRAEPVCLGEAAPWGLFIRACRAAGVGATLSLPVTGPAGDGPVLGTVNLYAASGDAFDGRVDELHRWCPTWAPAAAVCRTSGSGGTLARRRERAAAPEPHRDQNAVDWAVALLATELRTDTGTAAGLLRSAAVRAGLAESLAAQTLNRLLSP